MPLIAALLLTLTAAQSPAVQPPPSQPPKADAKSDQPARYTLGPQDQLKITVFDEPDLSNIYRVDSEGFITFPMINRVAASGLTPGELQDRIRTMLADYIRKPQVRVEVEGYKSQSVIIGGEVRSPGKIPMTGTMTLIEALAAAGSPTSSAASEVIVSRQKRSANGVIPNENDVEIIRVNLKEIQLGRAGRDVQLSSTCRRRRRCMSPAPYATRARSSTSPA